MRLLISGSWVRAPRSIISIIFFLVDREKHEWHFVKSGIWTDAFVRIRNTTFTSEQDNLLSLAPWTTRPFWQFENVTYDWLSFVNLTRCSWHIIINNDTCQGIADLTTRTMDVKQKPLLLTTSLTNKRKFSIDLKGIKTIWVHLH